MTHSPKLWLSPQAFGSLTDQVTLAKDSPGKRLLASDSSNNWLTHPDYSATDPHKHRFTGLFTHSFIESPRRCLSCWLLHPLIHPAPDSPIHWLTHPLTHQALTHQAEPRYCSTTRSLWVCTSFRSCSPLPRARMRHSQWLGGCSGLFPWLRKNIWGRTSEERLETLSRTESAKSW